MLVDELIYQIRKEFGFDPTIGQQHVLNVFADFMTDRDPRVVMVLRGAAGTGKTSLASAIVRTMVCLRQKVMLLAPTGRAAKVFSLHAGFSAFTIHRKIYLRRTFDGFGGMFTLNYNKLKDTLFFVDESSMISNEGYQDAAFGSGRLLDDLIRFVYSGQNCRMMLIGDKAQLPPVGELESPALSGTVLSMSGLKVYECDLDEVLRQSQTSGILYNATVIRRMITHDAVTQMPCVRFTGFPDIKLVSGDELIESLASSYSKVGVDETMVVTRSNKRANVYNLGIRNTILGREEELTSGDRLMVVRNNYFWTEMWDRGSNNANNGTQSSSDKGKFDFIANGDIAVVQRVRNVRELYGFRFADVWLQFPDYDDEEISLTILLDTLQTEAPALTHEQQERLFNSVLEDYADIPRKSERMKKLKEDRYYNSLQVKYGYAVTCHKAQGGQWEHVYLDQGYMTDDMLSPDYIHWLYTAFTRAVECLYLVNWPKTMTETEGDKRL